MSLSSIHSADSAKAVPLLQFFTCVFVFVMLPTTKNLRRITGLALSLYLFGFEVLVKLENGLC